MRRTGSSTVAPIGGLTAVFILLSACAGPATEPSVPATAAAIPTPTSCAAEEAALRHIQWLRTRAPTLPSLRMAEGDRLAALDTCLAQARPGV
ncbi:MAG: hypothetical protein RLO06_15090 [Parvibaculum sp.]